MEFQGTEMSKRRERLNPMLLETSNKVSPDVFTKFRYMEVN